MKIQFKTADRNPRVDENYLSLLAGLDCLTWLFFEIKNGHKLAFSYYSTQ